MEVKEDEDIAVASARSIEGFNLIEALQTMPELFLKFGGHAGAAGFTIPVKNIKSFIVKRCVPEKCSVEIENCPFKSHVL